MLQSIAQVGKKSVLMIAHNANYDSWFLLHLIPQQEVVDKAGRFLSVAGLFMDFATGRKVRLAIRDSYRMIEMPLRKFGESFRLDIEKEGKKYHVQGKVADFDACALYPSAMKRLGGYLLGAPKVLGPDQFDYDFPRQQDGYFVNVRVTSVAKRRQFPLASVVNRETGTREWTNDLQGQ